MSESNHSSKNHSTVLDNMSLKCVFFYVVYIFLFLLLTTSKVQSSTWVGQHATTYWGFVCYDKVNGALLATTNTNIYRSTDGGINWDQISNPPSEHIQLMISTTRGVIARSSSGNIYKTTDAGSSWTRLGGGKFSNVRAYSANDSGVIFIHSSSGLMVSFDDGLSWTSITNSNFDEPGYIKDLFVDNDGVLYVAHYLFSVYRSSDGGLNWQKNPNRFPSSPCSLASASDGTLYVGTYWNGVFKSEDQGSTWTSMSNGLPNGRGVAFIISDSSNNLYSLVHDQKGTVGLFHYDKNGETWMSAGGGLSVDQMRSSDISATDGITVWLAQGYYGIGASTNGGQSWAGFKSPIPQNVISMAATSDGTLYVGCNSTPYSVGPNPSAMGVFSTTDRGSTWLDLNEGLTEYDMAVQGIAVSNNNSLILLPYSPGQILTKKSPSCQWERQNFDNISSTFSSIYKSNNGTILIGNYWTGVHASLDGYNWNMLNNEGWPNGSGSGVVTQDSDGVIYADCRDQKSLKGLYSYTTSDKWTSVSSPGTSLTALLTTKNNNILAATHNGIYISYNKGANWEAYSNGLPTGTGAYAFFEACDDGTIYTATSGNVYGVYKHQTTGADWESMGFPLNNNVTHVYSLSFMNGYLFAGTNNGVFYSFENKCLDYPIDTTYDLNQNGTIELSDVILGLKILNNSSTSLDNMVKKDINNDGKIGLAEVVRILQKKFAVSKF